MQGRETIQIKHPETQTK